MIAEIVFAAGCFWGVEKHFEHVNGVVDVKSGYVGGNYANPSYEDLLKNKKSKDNYTEAVDVKFDTSKVSETELIKDFWELHDPTQKNRQGNDVGTNYRSAIYYTNETQHKIALETEDEYQKLLSKNGYGKIVTEIKPLKKFYLAESYHQDYLKNHPFGYCPNHSTGVKFKGQTIAKDMIVPLGGKEIIVVVAEGYCPYCEKFKKDVTSSYKGTLPLRSVTAKELSKFNIKSELFATPTILFIQDGKEVIGYKGYMDKDEFYKTLGAFKLGKDSEAYNIAFNKSTESSFCKQYDIFNHTPDGVFIDKLSGEILFDTRDRFNSGTGWLSFYKAVDGSVIEKEDNSYGMHRVEIIAKKSGIHLGHVFPYEGNKRRFCLNATVLEFVPRDKIKK
ncbi:MAG: peptide-methionine (S)-S-oxide reductase MsrA [Thiovulaceae bacterium]|nr:peptide-methionine (S)-S-oxide reductase MsrA [Sulfurimonadaceae bacterium]